MFGLVLLCNEYYVLEAINDFKFAVLRGGFLAYNLIDLNASRILIPIVWLRKRKSQSGPLWEADERPLTAGSRMSFSLHPSTYTNTDLIEELEIIIKK